MKDFDENATIGEVYGKALLIHSQKKANEYIEKIIKLLMSAGSSRENAERVAKSNIGYFAGYYDEKTRRRIEKLYGCHHPVFGAIGKKKGPSAKEALEAGKKWARKVKNV